LKDLIPRKRHYNETEKTNYFSGTKQPPGRKSCDKEGKKRGYVGQVWVERLPAVVQGSKVWGLFLKEGSVCQIAGGAVRSKSKAKAGETRTASEETKNYLGKDRDIKKEGHDCGGKEFSFQFP